MTDPKVHVGKVVTQKSATAPAAWTALGEIVAAAREYSQIRQTERTKRELIAAAERVQVERIRAAEDHLRDYFEKSFAERASTSKQLFERLDLALESGDPQLVHAVVRGIVDFAQTSPLAGVDDFGRFWAEMADKPIEL